MADLRSLSLTRSLSLSLSPPLFSSALPSERARPRVALAWLLLFVRA